MKQQSGFTIIELIVVISVLGILTATVLPRFAGLRDEAHIASLKGTLAAFKSGLSMVKAKSIARDTVGTGNGAVIGDCASIGTMAGVTLLVNAERGICGSDNATTALAVAACDFIWDQIIDGQSANAATTTTDYNTSFSGTTCTYTYNADGSTNMSISYNLNAVDDSAGNDGVTFDDDPTT